jgi:hypothetical protein
MSAPHQFGAEADEGKHVAMGTDGHQFDLHDCLVTRNAGVELEQSVRLRG